MRRIQLIALYLPFVLLASNLALGAVIVYGGFLVIDGDKQLGVVVSFIGYLRLALAPLPDIGAPPPSTCRVSRGSTRSSSCSSGAQRSPSAPTRRTWRRSAGRSSWTT
jgi:hypothetical protein